MRPVERTKKPFGRGKLGPLAALVNLLKLPDSHRLTNMNYFDTSLFSSAGQVFEPDGRRRSICQVRLKP